MQAAKRIEIIIGCSFDRRGHRFPNVNSNPAVARPTTASSQFIQPISDRVRAVVVETETIDQSSLFREPENPRLRITGLRFRGDGTDFNETESERGPSWNCHTVLVEASGEADRIREIQHE